MSRSVAFLWGGVAAVLVALAPWAAAFEGGFWPCIFKSLTGYPCPTCGLTRAAIALARFDVLGALGRYPLPTLAWMFLIGGGLLAAAMTLAGRTPPCIPSKVPTWVKAALVAVLLLNWAYSIATGV
jgi:hypothetical protein